MSFFGSVWGLSPHSSYVLVLVEVWSEKKLHSDRYYKIFLIYIYQRKRLTRPSEHRPQSVMLSDFFRIRLKASALRRATQKRPLCWISFPSFLAFGLGGQNGLKLLPLVTTDRALTVQLKDCQPHACCLYYSIEEANLGQEESGNKRRYTKSLGARPQAKEDTLD